MAVPQTLTSTDRALDPELHWLLKLRKMWIVAWRDGMAKQHQHRNRVRMLALQRLQPRNRAARPEDKGRMILSRRPLRTAEFG